MNIQWMKWIWIMAGGALGAVSRYGVSLLAARFLDGRFPWGTLIANLTGCFLIGAIFALAERTTLVGPTGRLFLMTGFLGALTTFSTYALESLSALRGGNVAIGWLNLAVNNIGGLTMALAGIGLIHIFLKGN